MITVFDMIGYRAKANAYKITGGFPYADRCGYKKI
jgi:hypothetical protein